jgi:hypothetical protein
MRHIILFTTLGVTALLHVSAALADCDHPDTEYERRDCERQRGDSQADLNVRDYLRQLEQQVGEERMRRAKEGRNGAQIRHPVVKVREGESEGEREMRETQQRYQNYRYSELAHIKEQFNRLNYSFEQPRMGAEGYFLPVWMAVPIASEMMDWAEKGYRKYPRELASLYGFMIAADPCAANPYDIGFPVNLEFDLRYDSYSPRNRYPECIYGRMYKAIPYLLEAQHSDFLPHRALACAQIEAWRARHFDDSGKPVLDPFLFQGTVYNEGDYRYLSEKLAQCRTGLPHAAAFDAGLVQPAREWVRKTRNYFADVRLTRFYSRTPWEKVSNYDDPAQIRAVFDEVLKDYNAITLAHPPIFTRGIDQDGGGWHAFR